MTSIKHIDLVDLKIFISKISSPVFIKDENHSWVMANDAFCQILGKTEPEILGKTDYDFFPEDESDVFWMKDVQVFNSDKPLANYEFVPNFKGETEYFKTDKCTFLDPNQNRYIFGVISKVGKVNIPDSISILRFIGMDISWGNSFFLGWYTWGYSPSWFSWKT